MFVRTLDWRYYMGWLTCLIDSRLWLRNGGWNYCLICCCCWSGCCCRSRSSVQRGRGCVSCCVGGTSEQTGGTPISSRNEQDLLSHTIWYTYKFEKFVTRYGITAVIKTLILSFNSWKIKTFADCQDLS